MNFLDSLKKQNLINETFLPIFFNDLLDDEDNDYWWAPEFDLPRLTHSISLFYLGLIQSYCFAQAQSTAQTVKELPVNEKIINTIVGIWDVDTPAKLNSTGELFSFFISVINENPDSLFFNAEFKKHFGDFKKAFETISSNSRTLLNVFSCEQFFDFLRSLPLLRAASFNKQTMKLEFFADNKTISVKASPFITFLSFDNSPLGETVEYPTKHCYILSSVSKGQKNDELFFDTLRLDSTKLEKDKKRICRQITNNENLKLLCKTADIKTQWYPVDDCWCDLKFLNKMVDATQNVLFKCCGISDLKFQGSENIKGKLLTILQDTELFETLQALTEIKACDLNDILFNLFLSEGLFRSVKSIVLNPKEIKKLSSDIMFDYYLQELVSSKAITSEEAKEHSSKCDDRINQSLRKLAHIVAEKSEPYIIRQREIDAEWKTYYILKAAGIKTNSLFADVETILSIDDYYDMLVNNDTSPEYDLMQLLRMLCIFYKALLKNGSTFNESKFFSDVKKIAPKYNITNHTLETLFNSFAQIAKETENSPEMAELIGRAGVGVEACKYIEFIREKLFGTETSTSVNNYTDLKSTEHAMFISYAHEDIDIVKPIVERWRNMGIDLFFDDSDIHHGENWEEIAGQCIKSDRCKIFVFFSSKASVCKEGVLKELRCAYYAKVNPEEPAKAVSGFIIPINLEKDTQGLKDYLPKMTTTPSDKNARQAASEILHKNYLELETSCINYHKLTPEEFDKEILKDYHHLTGSDGKVVVPFSFTPMNLAIANFYVFLKYGSTEWCSDAAKIHSCFNSKDTSQSKCIYPIVASIKEARIKRDNIAIVGYELIRGKGRQSESSHILTSKVLDVDDYYCIPKYRNSDNPGKYMIEPLLIKCDKFLEILSKSRGDNCE